MLHHAYECTSTSCWDASILQLRVLLSLDLRTQGIGHLFLWVVQGNMACLASELVSCC